MGPEKRYQFKVAHQEELLTQAKTLQYNQNEFFNHIRTPLHRMCLRSTP